VTPEVFGATQVRANPHPHEQRGTKTPPIEPYFVEPPHSPRLTSVVKCVAREENGSRGFHGSAQIIAQGDGPFDGGLSQSSQHDAMNR
jgi:hypothetical protein